MKGWVILGLDFVRVISFALDPFAPIISHSSVDG
jgi:hypothetical protein